MLQYEKWDFGEGTRLGLGGKTVLPWFDKMHAKRFANAEKGSTFEQKVKIDVLCKPETVHRIETMCFRGGEWRKGKRKRFDRNIDSLWGIRDS